MTLPQIEKLPLGDSPQPVTTRALARRAQRQERRAAQRAKQEAWTRPGQPGNGPVAAARATSRARIVPAPSRRQMSPTRTCG